ncbi:4Fe-4S dicluster domain-containing protein [Paenibacillus sabinae]|uniref:Electron transport protein n=1 Tax=Paenibacillus sabinae T27 TaxID=1268072 RepID=X4ZYR8_9BACL|nr:4Fe-4S dicluster domain-containing protein [Paenibacillus sabinae]AHV97313.1 electron transport protein [Paenibacillus sabinae T27]
MMNERTNSFVIAEAGKCIGCKACELACFAVHSQDNRVAGAVGTVATPVLPRLYVMRTESFTMPLQCRHCENAPCAGVCPVQAIRQEDGVILIDEDRCIGCKGCAMVCPFGAISLYKAYTGGQELKQPYLREQQNGGLDRKARVVAYKCDLCRNIAVPGTTMVSGEMAVSNAGYPSGSQSGDGGGPVPACVSVCPEQALTLVSPERETARSRAAESLSCLSRLKL